MRYGHNEIAIICRIALHAARGSVADLSDDAAIYDFAQANSGCTGNSAIEARIAEWALERSLKAIPNRIPTSHAKRYGMDNGQHLVVCLSYGRNGSTHLVTWGADKEMCDAAALAGQRVSDNLGLGIKVQR